VNRSRRSFCELAGRGLLAAAAAGVGPARAAEVPKLGSVTWQLGWLETVEYAGSYVADANGYYRAQGIDVTIAPGGPSVAVPPLVVAGRALIGNSTISAVAQARTSGAPLKIVATGWQRNPEVFISLASKPIAKPADLIGKRLGIPSDDLVDALGFLHVNNIRDDQVHVVPVQYDPTPLVAGEIDAFFGISTNEPIKLALHGVATHQLAIENFGVPGLFQPYFVREDALTDPATRARLKAFLRAERLGWREALRDPDLGVRLTLQTYGAALGLDPKGQQLESRATNAMFTSTDTQAHGLLWMPAAKIAGTIAALHRAGIAMRANDLFDTSLLAELNAEKASR